MTTPPTRQNDQAGEATLTMDVEVTPEEVPRDPRELIRLLLDVDVSSEELQTQDLLELWDRTGNLYQSVFIIGKRATQIHRFLTDQIRRLRAQLVGAPDDITLEEQKQPEIEQLIRVFESAPDPVLIATEEFKQGKTFYRPMGESARR